MQDAIAYIYIHTYISTSRDRDRGLQLHLAIARRHRKDVIARRDRNRETCAHFLARKRDRVATHSQVTRKRLQHTVTQCNTLQHTATPCNTLRHTATHCDTLQHTATHCRRVLIHDVRHLTFRKRQFCCHFEPQGWSTRWPQNISTLQHAATHCRQNISTLSSTGWRRGRGCLKLQVIFRKRHA